MMTHAIIKAIRRSVETKLSIWLSEWLDCLRLPAPLGISFFSLFDSAPSAFLRYCS